MRFFSRANQGFPACPSPRGPGSRGVRGFTLVEMMIVVAIIGVIAAIAIPGFMQYVYKARRTEALVALQVINDLQTLEFGNTGRYSNSFVELGFNVDGGELLNDSTVQGDHYTYTVEALTLNGVPFGNYRATATGDIDPSDSVLDVIIIENSLTVVQ